MREIYICYTTIIYEVHTFKNKNKRNSFRNISDYHFLFYFIRSCQFVIIETRAYDIAREENVMRSLIIQKCNRVRSKAGTGVL